MTEPPARDPGSTVLVVTAMRLSKAARAELSEMLGPGYTVVDMRSAPSTANIVLAPVSSGTALGILRGEFPQARILFTELQDDERGINLTGPLSRIVAQAPDGYFVAQSLDALTPVVQSEAHLQLTGSNTRTPLTLSLTTGLPVSQQAADGPIPSTQHLPDEAEAAQVPPAQQAVDARVTTTVHWIDRATCESAPRGEWLDLEPLDALVRRLVGTDEPRRDILWPALAAECVIRLADHCPDDVLVDVAGLEPTIRAELQIRVATEHVTQANWP